MISNKLSPCPKCKCKKIEIVSTPMQLTPDKSQYQVTCTKRTCNWRGAWSSTAESAVASWNNFNNRNAIKSTKK